MLRLKCRAPARELLGPLGKAASAALPCAGWRSALGSWCAAFALELHKLWGASSGRSFPLLLRLLRVTGKSFVLSQAAESGPLRPSHADAFRVSATNVSAGRGGGGGGGGGGVLALSEARARHALAAPAAYGGLQRQRGCRLRVLLPARAAASFASSSAEGRALSSKGRKGASDKVRTL